MSLINLYFGHLCLFPSTINQPVPCFPVAAHNCKFTKTLVTFEHVTSLSGASDSSRGWAVSIIKHWTGFGQLCVIIVGIFLPPLCVIYKVLTLWQLRQNIQERHKIKKLLFSRLLCNKCIWFTVTRYPVTLLKDDCTSSRDWDPDKKNNRARRDNNCYNGLLTQQHYNYETKIKCQWVRNI